MKSISICLISFIFTFTISAKNEVSKICAPQPLKHCSRLNPCNKGLKSASEIPNCHIDGAAKSLTSKYGNQRFYCQFSPSTTTKKPLIIFLHGGAGNAENVYKSTELRRKAQHLGFHLISLQSRNVEIDFGEMKDGRHHDSYYWDFATHSKNRDIADMDLLIAKTVKKYNIDTKRIYLIGWSEGGLFSQLYGMVRERYPSPFGHKVAAVVAYSSSNPFERKYENKRECKPKLNIKSSLPIYFISRSCDIIPCNKNHENPYTQPSWADAKPIDGWINTLETKLGNKNIEYMMVDEHGDEATKCSKVRDCNRFRSVINHISWPTQQEQSMLKFLFKKR